MLRGGIWSEGDVFMSKDSQASWNYQELEENMQKGKFPVIWWGEEVILPSVLSKILTVVNLETNKAIRKQITIGWFAQTSCHVKIIGVRNGRDLLFDFTMSKDGSIFDAKISSYKQEEESYAVA